ncbi:MAG: hypothetical protein AAGH38_04165 [Pseudomonadota bacterium]
MLRTAFDRSRFADLLHAKERVEADKRRSREFNCQRQERERKEEMDDKAAEATAAAFAVAMDMSPPASTLQIAAFDAELTTYDTALIQALMENEQLMEAVKARLEVLFGRAFVMDDGRRVFRTEDGTQVFDEFGEQVLTEELDPDLIPENAPTWEEVQPDLQAKDALAMEREALAGYQTKIEAAREELVEGEITEEELKALSDDLLKTMPDVVRAKLPEDHPAKLEWDQTAEAEPAIAASLIGLGGFAPPTPGE